MAERSRAAVSPAVSRYTGTIRPACRTSSSPCDRLELRVVEGQLPAEPLDPAGDHDLLVHLEPPLDVPPPEPGRLDRPGLVASGPRPCAGRGAGTRAHRDIGHADPCRDDGPGLHAARGRRAGASRAGRRTVAAGGTGGRGRRRRRAACRPAAASRPAGRARTAPAACRGARPGRPAAGTGLVALGTPTPPRSGTGSRAGRRGGPPRRSRAPGHRCASPSPRPRRGPRRRRRRS